jgi:hypothetical protein
MAKAAMADHGEGGGVESRWQSSSPREIPVSRVVK